jgi:hypothetical protein
MDSKDNIENISTNTSDRAIDKETVLNTDKIKREKNIYSNQLTLYAVFDNSQFPRHFPSFYFLFEYFYHSCLSHFVH